MTQRCPACIASLSYLVGDDEPYELIEPLEGGYRALVPHTEERCRFHRFLTPELVPDSADELLAATAPQRWVRTDMPTA